MHTTQKSVWFDGSTQIQGDLGKIKKSFQNLGKHYTEVVGLMPGIRNPELIEEGHDYIIIKTNEGIMKRTAITIESSKGELSIAFDEEYQAKKTVTTTSHYAYTFRAEHGLVALHLTISHVKAAGILGFFYRKLGGNNIGNATLQSYKTYFER